MQNINWHEEVLKCKPDLIAKTQEFLRIESVLDPATATASRPFGDGIEKALTYMLSKGKEDNFSVKNIDHYVGYVEFGKGQESIGVLCHLDVVPAGDGWTTPAFAADIREGRIYARGAIDNKGPMMAIYFAMKIVKDLDLALSKRVRLILGTDEESDWRCVSHYFANEEMPTVGFAPDADFPIIYAEKGIADIKVSFANEKKGFTDESSLVLLEFEAGERLNMVPEGAVAEIKGEIERLEEVEKQFQEFIVQNGEGSIVRKKDVLTLKFKGESAHGSTPERGINAGLLLALFINSLHLQKDAKIFFEFINLHLVNDLHGKNLGIYQEDNISGPLTVNVGILKFNGQQGHLGLNLRYPVTAKGEELIKNLSTTLTQQNNWSLEIINHMEPSYVEKNHPLIKTLKTVYERQTGEKAELLSIGGGTYARSLDVGVAFGPLFPKREDVAHRKDEYIEIDDLLKATAIYAEAIYELAK
ncbi:dipeptidase PepV [Bacillus solitudinis]|uniref:dipeptidase PepV n=1 Tax=Bacillus solitudinis TaxID=2014074 RepID=UPI000C240BF7|nr:dipeptidase PepV [Bacillus solitudinis]